MKTVYLFRHSLPDKTCALVNEKIPLSVRGRELMIAFVKQLGIRGCAVYTSPYQRALETAALIGENVIIDERLSERKIGCPTAFSKELWMGQYADGNLHDVGGESFDQVRYRMNASIMDILSRMEDRSSVAVVSHGAAICAWMQGFCSVKVNNVERKCRKIVFQHTTVWDGPISAPSCFVMSFEDDVVKFVDYVPCGHI